MSAEAAKKPFSTNSGTVGDITSYLQGWQRNIRELIESLTGSDIASVQKRSYLKSYMGDYSGALAERDALCKTTIDQCPMANIILDVGTAQDQSGATIESPRVYLNGQAIAMESAIAQPLVYSDMVQRVRIEKEGYLDSYGKLNDIEWASKTFSVQPTLAKAATQIKIDANDTGTYTGSDISYTITPDTFATIDGKKVTGTIDVYLFGLTRSDNDLSAFQLDVFSASWVNVWSRMITDGMPFVTAYQDGQELNIIKPIVGIGKMKSDRLMTGLKSVPKNTWLSPTELEKYNLPGFWRLNRSSGVWMDSEMQILDETGTYMFNFQ